MADAHPKFDVSVVTPDGAVYEGENTRIRRRVAMPRSASSSKAYTTRQVSR